jgi:16S rRNA (adenine1518-N6/adenine1519-N6)-dimethyltransferase
MRNIGANKTLGQNWLVNEGVADRIVAAAHPEKTDTILEIGPGKGVLTGRLVRHVGQLIAIEKDGRLVGPLREQFANTPNVSIHEGDVLELDPQALGLKAGEYKVVANLPYYITARFLRHMLSQWPAPKRAVLMIQREVSKRIQEQPGNMNMLALSVQAYAEIEKIMDVSRGSFRPTPDVDSTVIALTPKKLDQNDRDMTERALETARRSFENRRKQITSSQSKQLLLACNISPTARPQELSWEQWLCITEQKT